MTINEKVCKCALTRSKLPEVEYCLNPYIGCMHSCIYCYATFMKRFTGHTKDIWGNFVDVRTNIVEIATKELKKYSGGTILMGSVTDCYQPCEKKYELTRNLLRTLLEVDASISILTKSDLVLRDIDLLKRFSDCDVGLTITTLNADNSRLIEPRAILPEKRINALRTLKQNNLQTYAFVGPVIPQITDLEDIFSKLHEINVDYVMVEVLNVKCGNIEKIKEACFKFEEIQKIFFQNEYQQYVEETERKVKELSNKYKIVLKGFYKH